MRPVDATARRARGSVAERRAREGENDDGESADDAVAACLITGDDDGVRATCDGASDGGRDAATSGGDAGDDGGGDDDGDGDGGETRGGDGGDDGGEASGGRPAAWQRRAAAMTTVAPSRPKRRKRARPRMAGRCGSGESLIYEDEVRK